MNKDRVLKLRVTEDQLAAIRRRAGSHDVSMSEYVRRKVLEESNGPVIICTQPEELKAIYRALRLSASNLNQITREMHRHGIQGMDASVADAARRIEEASDDVSSFLRDARNIRKRQ